MATYLLDSSTLSFLMENRPPVVQRVNAARQTDRLITCTIARGEILFGLERMPPGRRRSIAEDAAADAFSYIPCESVPEYAAEVYARIKRRAELNGAAQGENDLWIAATAIAFEATLVTSDTDFRRIRGLKTEDWMQ